MSYKEKIFNSDIIKNYILNEKSHEEENLIFCEKIRITNSFTYPHVEDIFIFKQYDTYYGVINGYCGDSGIYSEKWNLFIECYELEKYNYQYQNCEEIGTDLYHEGHSYKYINK
jgi:hypothetical protein